jgi:hypothetical protein
MIPAPVINAGLVIVGESDSVAPVPVPSPPSALASPKSSTFTVPFSSDFDVRGLQIAVNDSLFVRRFERLRDLLRDRQRLVERDRALRDPL